MADGELLAYASYLAKRYHIRGLDEEDLFQEAYHRGLLLTKRRPLWSDDKVRLKMRQRLYYLWRREVAREQHEVGEPLGDRQDNRPSPLQRLIHAETWQRFRDSLNDRDRVILDSSVVNRDPDSEVAVAISVSESRLRAYRADLLLRLSEHFADSNDNL